MQNIIEEIEAVSSRLAKEAIIQREALADNVEFFEGCRWAYDSLVTFGIKKVPVHSGPDGQGLPWSAFRDLLVKLSNRELTGNEAKAAVELCLSIATQSQWNNWYRRILIKDLRAGFTATTINNVCERINKPNFKIFIFKCQLAHDSANHEKQLVGKKLVEVKLDGVRVITIVYPNGTVKQYSRNGQELLNFENIKEQFSKTKVPYPTVFDGEIMSTSFQDLMKQVHRKSNVNATDAVLHLFDVLPLEQFQLQRCNTAQTERIKQLILWKDQWAQQTPNIEVLAHEIVDLSTEDGYRRFKQINQQAIDGGYEGIMIKTLDAPYTCERTVNWLKLKPFIEVSLTVIKTEEGTGKNVGRMGALVCEGIDNGKLIRVNVGSGFTDQQRVDFWECQVNGFVIEIRADAVTQNQDGSYSLRFPRFKSFRGFKPSEKL